MELESQLGITIPDESLDRANLTLGDVAKAICDQCGVDNH
jgi:acyl carrier protein